MKVSAHTAERIERVSQSVNSQNDQDSNPTPRRPIGLFPAKELRSSVDAWTWENTRCRAKVRPAVVGGMSRLQMDVEPVFNWTVFKPLAASGWKWLKNASVMTASFLGVAFVTLSIGFTGLNPLDELHAQHERTVEAKSVREKLVAALQVKHDAMVKGEFSLKECQLSCASSPTTPIPLCQRACSEQATLATAAFNPLVSSDVQWF